MLETIALMRKPGTRKDYDQAVAVCCQECSVGCGLWVYVKDERIVDIQGNELHPVNRGRLCARGVAFVQGLTSADRITLPGTRNRQSGPFEAFDNWEKGIDLLAERLRRIKDQHGPRSLIIGCDPQAGPDFYYGALRFARLWGTPHVYHPLQEPVDAAFPAELKHPDIYSRAWSQSRCLLLIEADLAATHPVAFRQVLAAQRGGTMILAADSRFTATLSKADAAVLIAPNQGNELGLALMKMLLKEGLSGSGAERRYKDFHKWADTYAALSDERLEAATGLRLEKIRTMARALGRFQPTTLITAKRLALNPHYGIWSTMARAMGWSEAGGGWYPLESGTPALDPTAGLEEVEPAGGRWPDVLNEADIKALIGSGDCLGDFLAPMQKQVNDMDLMVYFGSFPNRTRQAAHMVFPATAWAERDGVVFTNDGAVQWSPRVIKPNDACRTGLGFWMRLAQRFGWEAYFPWKKANGLADQKAFYQWLFENSPHTGGLQMDRIARENAQVHWFRERTGSPEPDDGLMPAPDDVSDRPTPTDPAAYPLLFQTTRTMTRSGDAGRWWPWARELEDETAIQIHPVVAEALGVDNGETILAASEDEIIEGPAVISRMVPPRLIWSLQRMRTDRVLIYRKGQAPEEARDRLKAIEG